MKDQNLRGVGGWLALIAAFQVIYILQHLRQALSIAMRGQLTPFTVGEIAGNLSGILLVLYCTVLLFRERRSFPSLYLLQVWLITGFHVLAIVLAVAKLRLPHGMAIEIGAIAFNLMFALIATLYINRSVRVRNTFVT